MSTARRVYFYLVTAITLGIFAAGVGNLLSLVFDVIIKGPAQVGGISFNQQQFSLGLAMTIIGGPLWFMFWRAIQNRVTGNQEEIGAGMRKFYLNLILLVTAITGLNSLAGFLIWLIAGVPQEAFSSGGLAAFIVAGIVWYYHWRVSETEGHPSPAAKTLRRWYVYYLSAFGLVWLAAGPVLLINSAVVSLPVVGTIVRGQFWNGTSQMSVVWIVLGGLTWYFHWTRMARDDFDSVLRQVYFYLLAIFGAAIAALVALTVTIYQIFIWIFGGVTTSAGQHFQFLGWAIPTILVGVGIWAYHRSLAQEEASQTNERWLSPQRIHFYLMSFLGLGTLVSGLVAIFGLFLGFIISGAGTQIAEAPGWWRGQLSLSLALLLVGTLMWLYYWSRILQRAVTGGLAESRSRSRRIYLYVIVGASIVALAASLVNIVYQLLNTVLQSTSGLDLLRYSKWSLQALIVAVPLLWYHWQITRADQKSGAEAAAVHKNVTFLAGAQMEAVISRLEDKLGYKIRVLHKVEPEGAQIPVLSDEELAVLAGEIQSAPSTKVLLVTIGGRILVMPYLEK
ncbi:MAG: DUF5671 domain-containing protein [Dehalococcoidales bacterium]|nr:DUF5671 domain-containing protein [Dehalococcoidales bacterium]